MFKRIFILVSVFMAISCEIGADQSNVGDVFYIKVFGGLMPVSSNYVVLPKSYERGILTLREYSQLAENKGDGEFGILKVGPISACDLCENEVEKNKTVRVVYESVVENFHIRVIRSGDTFTTIFYNSIQFFVVSGCGEDYWKTLSDGFRSDVLF